jgi:hypothetical protein
MLQHSVLVATYVALSESHFVCMCRMCCFQGTKGGSSNHAMVYDCYKQLYDGAGHPRLRKHGEIVRSGADAEVVRQRSLSLYYNRIAAGAVDPLKKMTLPKLDDRFKGVYGTCELSRLPYYDIPQMCVLDMMHLIGNVFKDHLIPIFAGSRDTLNTRVADEAKASAEALRIKNVANVARDATRSSQVRNSNRGTHNSPAPAGIQRGRGRPPQGQHRSSKQSIHVPSHSPRRTRGRPTAAAATSAAGTNRSPSTEFSSNQEVHSDTSSSGSDGASSDGRRDQLPHRKRRRPSSSRQESEHNEKASRKRTKHPGQESSSTDEEQLTDEHMESEDSSLSSSDDELGGESVRVSLLHNVEHVLRLCCKLCSLLSYFFVLCRFCQAWSLGKAHRRMVMPEEQRKLLEAKCVQLIQGPSGVVNGQPLSLIGQNNTYHWLNFVRLHGKYLLSQYFTGSVLKLLCEIIDLVKMLLTTTLTEALHLRIEICVRRISKNISILPNTERPIVFHNLISHMPMIIKKWGPPRSYWCFPFERYVAHYMHMLRFCYLCSIMLLM